MQKISSNLTTYGTSKEAWYPRHHLDAKHCEIIKVMAPLISSQNLHGMEELAVAYTYQ